MRLSAKLLVNYSNVNMFGYQNQWDIRAGDPTTLYFQLVDLDQDGLRYLAGLNIMSPATFGVTVTFPSIDDTKVIKIAATPVSASDTSIWAINILSTQIPASGNVVFSVQEGTAVRNFNLKNALSVEYAGADGSC